MFTLMLQIAPDNPSVIFLFFHHAEHCISRASQTHGKVPVLCQLWAAGPAAAHRLPVAGSCSCTRTVWRDAPACGWVLGGGQPSWGDRACPQSLGGNRCSRATRVAHSKARPGAGCAHSAQTEPLVFSETTKHILCSTWREVVQASFCLSCVLS